MDPLTAACLQLEHGATVKESLSRAHDHLARAAQRGADLALLPEYWWVARDGGGFRQAAFSATSDDLRAWLADRSRDLGIAIAGNVLDQPEETVVRNVLEVYENGRRVGSQAKVHPMPNEADAGLGGGDGFDPFPVRGIPTGALVCADVFYPEAARVLSLRGAEMILNPVMSPYREEDPTKDARTAVYVARAWDAGAFVLKAGGFSRAEPRVAGRSLIAAPWGLLAKAGDDFREENLTAELDFERLRAFREGHRGFQARAPAAYRHLVDLP